MPLEKLLNWFFPPTCITCKTEGDFLCKNCIDSLNSKPIVGTDPKGEWQYLDGVIYALDYEKNPTIQSAIKQFKYKFTKSLATHFGTLITQKLNELNMIKGKQACFVPVPLHKKRLHYRGFNQAELLSNAIEFPHINIPCLDRIKNTTQQAKLRKRERHENLKDAFLVNKKFIHEQIIYSSKYTVFIVDDVCTTGATLENCAKVLKEAGIRKVYGLVVARQFR